MERIKEYINKNNILGYLSYGDDFENLKNYIDQEDFEEQRGWNERVETIEDYIFYIILQYNYDLAVENEDIEFMLELIYGCEFDIEINENGKLDLIDLQGVYLGDIDSYMNFEEIADVLDRLSGSYIYDYYGIE